MSVPITQDRLQELLAYYPETGIFVWRVDKARAKAGQIAGAIHRLGYRHIRIDGKCYKAHRLAWLYVHGRFPKEELDHKNRVRHDDRIGNLREATHSQNQANAKARHNGLKGTSFIKAKGKWVAKIHKDKKTYCLGHFQTEEQAHCAYVVAAPWVHQDFWRAA